MAASFRTPSGVASGTASTSSYCAYSWNSRGTPGSGQSEAPPPLAPGHMCQWSSSTVRTASGVRITSATSMGLGSTRSPRIEMPSSRRTVDLPPSAATR